MRNPKEDVFFYEIDSSPGWNKLPLKNIKIPCIPDSPHRSQNNRVDDSLPSSRPYVSSQSFHHFL
ncbi:hypothetical protein Hanom_Chr04g00338601 [Helianthus anomalus]